METLTRTVKFLINNGIVGILDKYQAHWMKPYLIREVSRRVDKTT